MIQGDRPVTIGRNTAIEALAAMERCAKEGFYTELFDDDRSFVWDAIRELRLVIKESGDARPDQRTV